jgi:hypothetical protein
MTKTDRAQDPKAAMDKDPKAAPHTELRPAGTGPRPRSKVMPPELRDEPGDDDPFNDMPV